jgi:hypothetical protein
MIACLLCSSKVLAERDQDFSLKAWNLIEQMVEGRFVHDQYGHTRFSNNGCCPGFSIDEGYLPEKVATGQLPDDFSIFLDPGLTFCDKNELPSCFPLLNQYPTFLHLHLIRMFTDFPQMALAKVAEQRYFLEKIDLL